MNTDKNCEYPNGEVKFFDANFEIKFYFCHVTACLKSRSNGYDS